MLRALVKTPGHQCSILDFTEDNARRRGYYSSDYWQTVFIVIGLLIHLYMSGDPTSYLTRDTTPLQWAILKGAPTFSR